MKETTVRQTHAVRTAPIRRLAVVRRWVGTPRMGHRFAEAATEEKDEQRRFQRSHRQHRTGVDARLGRSGRPPPEGAPNVVFIVLDDTGFAHLGCYGSDIETPNMDRLAAGGLRYNNFHTTALCSPTRACLLTGRNHHSVGVGRITEITSGFPGYYGQITDRAATLAEVLRSNGYNTIACGKWHLLAELAHVGGRAVRPVAARARVRPLLRLPRRRDRSVAPRPGGGQRAHPAARPRGLPPDGGPRRPRDRLCAPAEVARAGEAVLPLPGVRRHPRAAPRAEGVHREVPREVSTTVGTPPATASSRARRRWASSRRTRNSRRATTASRRGRT